MRARACAGKSTGSKTKNNHALFVFLFNPHAYAPMQHFTQTRQPCNTTMLYKRPYDANADDACK